MFVHMAAQDCDTKTTFFPSHLPIKVFCSLVVDGDFTLSSSLHIKANTLGTSQSSESKWTVSTCEYRLLHTAVTLGLLGHSHQPALHSKGPYPQVQWRRLPNLLILCASADSCAAWTACLWNMGMALQSPDFNPPEHWEIMDLQFRHP